MTEEETTPDRTPPAGSVCRAHPDRPGVALCPECERAACLLCWLDPYDRCETCLRVDPAAAVATVPFEDAERNALGRFTGMLGDAFFPTRRAPSFVGGAVRPAATFALLTAPLLAMLAGVIPFTHTLRFGPTFAVTPIGAPTQDALIFDIARAAGLGLLVHVVAAAALAVCYVSLIRAYGTHEERSSLAIRAVLYRSWLVPLSGSAGLLIAVLGWSLPEDPNQTVVILLSIVLVVPTILLFVHLRAVARFAAGTSIVMSFVVVVVPFVFMMAAEGLLQVGLAPLMPDVERPADLLVSEDG